MVPVCRTMVLEHDPETLAASSFPPGRIGVARPLAVAWGSRPQTVVGWLRRVHRHLSPVRPVSIRALAVQLDRVDGHDRQRVVLREHRVSLVLPPIAQPPQLQGPAVARAVFCLRRPVLLAGHARPVGDEPPVPPHIR